MKWVIVCLSNQFLFLCQWIFHSMLTVSLSIPSNHVPFSFCSHLIRWPENYTNCKFSWTALLSTSLVKVCMEEGPVKLASKSSSDSQPIVHSNQVKFQFLNQDMATAMLKWKAVLFICWMMVWTDAGETSMGFRAPAWEALQRGGGGHGWVFKSHWNGFV